MRDDKFTNVLQFSRSHLIFILFSANISFYWLPFFVCCVCWVKWNWVWSEWGGEGGLWVTVGFSRCAFAVVGLGSLPVNFINIFMMRLGDRTVIWARKCCHASPRLPPPPLALCRLPTGQRNGELGFLGPHAKCFVVLFPFVVVTRSLDAFFAHFFVVVVVVAHAIIKIFLSHCFFVFIRGAGGKALSRLRSRRRQCGQGAEAARREP